MDTGCSVIAAEVPLPWIPAFAGMTGRGYFRQLSNPSRRTIAMRRSIVRA